MATENQPTENQPTELPPITMMDIKEHEMIVFVAPDGAPQLMTLADGFAECVGITTLLSEHGISQHPAELFAQGYQILPVKITIVQNGNAQDAFNRGLERMSKMNTGKNKFENE